MKPFDPIITHTTYPFHITYTDEEKLPIDITGATGKLMVKRTLFSEAIVTKDAVIDGLEGTALFKLKPADTAKLIEDDVTETKVMVGATLTLADGEVVPLFQAEVEVKRNIVTTE